MARFSNGWFKVYREITLQDIGGNGYLLAIWVRLLSWASIYESTICWAGKPTKIPPGTVVISMQELADSLQFSKKTVFKWIKYLEARESIGIHTGNGGTIIFIKNWSKYQRIGNGPETAMIDISHGNTKEISHSENRVETAREHEVNTAETPGKRHGNTRYPLNEEVRKKNKELRIKSNVGIRLDYPQDFEEVWLSYGKRGDKKAAFQEWKSLKLSEVEIALLHKAIKSYTTANEWKFRKHLGRFLKTDWRHLEQPPIDTGNDQSSSKNSWSFLDGDSRSERKTSNG